MRTGVGIIEEILDNGLAKVKVSRDSLYVACSVCAGAEHVFLTAKNSLGAEEGQSVRYEVQDDHLIMGSFMCFIMPLIIAVAVGLIGHSIGTSVGFDDFYSGTVGAVIGLLISAAIVRTYDASLSQRVDTKANITAIIIEEPEDGE
jgi:sigma-E factor negative regulatory protein RseC